MGSIDNDKLRENLEAATEVTLIGAMNVHVVTLSSDCFKEQTLQNFKSLDHYSMHF